LGVRRMLSLAKRCKNLVSIVHISTCYVTADKPNGTYSTETVYPMKTTPYQVIERVKDLTLEEAHKITNEVIGNYPNTYSFTKAVGEHLLEAERGDLPLCVLRPSIVTAALEEPLKGWIDVLLGPAGLFLAAGMGALRVMRGNINNVVDFVPVDVVCNAIAALWRNVKLAKESPDFPKKYPIYQVCTSTANPVPWLWSQYIVPQYFVRHRPKRAFGTPYAFFCGNPTLFSVLNYVLHYVPAMIMDAGRVLQGKKMFMMRAASKLHRTMDTLKYFTTTAWHFASDNTSKLLADLSEEDKNTYKFDVKVIDWDHYFITFCHGIREFLLKEDEVPSKPAEKQQMAIERPGFFKSLLEYTRSYLLIISLGCFLYFFRQNFWILQLRAKQLRQSVRQLAARFTLPKLLAQ